MVERGKIKFRDPKFSLFQPLEIFSSFKSKEISKTLIYGFFEIISLMVFEENLS